MVIGLFLVGLTILILIFIQLTTALVRTAKWKMSTDMSATTYQHPLHCLWKRGVRIKAGDTGISDDSRNIAYGASDEFTVGIHFRLENCFGGHGATRLIAHQHDGASGWKIEYIVGTGKIQVSVDDNIAATITTDADLDEEDIEWWVFTFLKNDIEGLNLYKGDQLMNTASTVGLVDIKPADTDMELGDAAATVAMMFGGFFFMDSIIDSFDLAEVNTTPDDEWTLTGTLNIHIPGLSHDWGGAIGVDVDEGNSQWKDVSGNIANMDFTLADDVNSMARMCARKVGVLDGALESMVFSRHGSTLSMKVSEENTIDVGDAVIMYMPSNKWTGYIERVKKGVGGKLIKAIGLDEESTDPFENYVFADREQNQKDVLEDGTNLIFENTDGGAEAGSMFVRLNNKISLGVDALRHDYGFADGFISDWFGSNVVWELIINDFQLISRELSVKDSASEVDVYGYGNANLPEQETFIGAQTTSVLTYKPVEIIKVEDATDGILYSDSYTVDSDNKSIHFAPATTDDIVVDYTHRSPNTANATDSDIEEEIGKKKKLMVWVGYIGDAPLATIANAMLRGKYWVLSIKPNAKKFYNKRWYVGQKIRINMSTDHFGINGYYFITKVIFEGNIHSVPRIEMEEYESGGALPFVHQASSITDIIDRIKEESQHSNQGFYA